MLTLSSLLSVFGVGYVKVPSAFFVIHPPYSHLFFFVNGWMYLHASLAASSCVLNLSLGSRPKMSTYIRGLLNPKPYRLIPPSSSIGSLFSQRWRFGS